MSCSYVNTVTFLTACDVHVCSQLSDDVDYSTQRFQFARAPPFPRLGYEEYTNEIRRELGDEPRQIYTIPRAGRFIGGGRQRRSIDDVSIEDALTENKRSSPRLGTRSNLPLPRLGMYQRSLNDLYNKNSNDEDDEDLSILMPRLGYRALAGDVNSYKDSLQRLGLLGEKDVVDDKRAMGMLRMGKREPEQLDKRAMGMLRMGRAMGMLRMGKRSGMSMLRMGRSMDANSAEEEAEEHKRAMGMLRMGRSMDDAVPVADDVTTNEESKRAMGMMRMGRPAPGMRTARGMSMLRLGRSQSSVDDDAQVDESEKNKRGMGMLRMGKRDTDDVTAKDKKNLSMLRMGKKDQNS